MSPIETARSGSDQVEVSPALGRLVFERRPRPVLLSNWEVARDEVVRALLDRPEVGLVEVRRFEVDPGVVGVDLIARRARVVVVEDDLRDDVLGGVVSHMGMATVPVEFTVDRGPRLGDVAVEFVSDLAVVLADVDDVCLAAVPRERPVVGRLAAALLVEQRSVEHDARARVVGGDDLGVERALVLPGREVELLGHDPDPHRISMGVRSRTSPSGPGV